jgi:AcrR family transcriptional regulator
MATTPETSVRERLLTAASDLFYREGIRAVGVQRVIEEAEAAKASLYSHFPSKDDLVAAYLERMSAGTQGRLEQAVTRAGPDPRRQILALFDAIDEWGRSPDFRGCPFTNACSELADEEHAGRAAIDRHRGWLRDRIAQLARATGNDDPSLLGRAILLLLDGATTATILDRDPDAVRTARRAAERLLQL